jgi:ASC-1-like (ASCH) protein/ADP-ribose pyrophosphatase YjhB (NUDIX family)
MLHKMKLKESPFERIKNGTKPIEFRLYDEKRQQIKIGDKIEFSKLPDLQEKILVDVIDLYRADTFENLFRKLYSDEEEIIRKTKAMYEIYSPEKEQQYGILGIKIKINVDNLKENIEKFIPYNEQEQVERKIMLDYIRDFDDTLTRQNEYGHFTSSAFVLNKERTKILMIYHKIYNSWAWVGGHSDGDSDLLYVAMKEAKEETGIKNVVPISKDIYSLEIINVNGHEKRGKYVGSHVHLNVTYLLEADENEEIHIKEDENSGVKWVPINDILKETSEPWVRDRVYAKIIDKMRKDGIV